MSVIPQETYDPEAWLETATRVIHDYTYLGLHKSVKDDQNNYVGNQIYQVVMEFPSTDEIMEYVPVGKTVVHFAADALDNYILGFGDNIAQEDRSVPGLIQVQEGRRHQLNFDVGIWSSDRSGGTTARMRAYQVLTNLFCGSLAIEALRQASDGGDGAQVELIHFMGGKFLVENANDIRLFRMVDCSLEVRVFSRTPSPFDIPEVQDIGIESELVLHPDLIILN